MFLVSSVCVNLDPYRDFIHELAAASAEAILPWYGSRSVGVERKADESPVTVADRGAEEVMRGMIEKRYPQHGIVGEEFGTVRADAEFVWVLDPIDGTKSFITAVPLFGTLVGLLYQGKPVLGCVHQPVLGKLLLGDGKVTTLNGERVQIRPAPSIDAATLLTSDPLLPGRHQNGPAFEALAQSVRLYRSFGDCYGYLLVASGWADIMVDPIMNSWDLLPLIPCIEGAGGRITDWQGRDATRPGANSAVACAPELHDEILKRLNP